MIMILLRHMASCAQQIGKADANQSRRCEYFFQCEQICESVLGAPAIPLEILWIDLEQYCFSERNIRLLQRCGDFL
jgi:hypothetical protein